MNKRIEELPEINAEFSDYYIKKMTMYSETIKTYIQIAMATLVVPITFYKQLLGLKDDDPVILDNWLICSWIVLLLSIGLGLFYQYFAIKRIETRNSIIIAVCTVVIFFTHMVWLLQYSKRCRQPLKSGY